MYHVEVHELSDYNRGFVHILSLKAMNHDVNAGGRRNVESIRSQDESGAGTQQEALATKSRKDSLPIQDRIITRVLGQAGPVSPPPILRLATSLPFVRRLVARALGLGVRPEHVRTPAIRPTR